MVGGISLTMGALIACVMLTSRALQPMGQLAGLLVSYHHGTASSATMTLASVIIFLVVLTGRVLYKKIWAYNKNRT